MKKTTLICCMVLSASLFTTQRAWSQTNEQSGLIKTANGILVVWNEPGNFYTIEIVGRSINPVQGELLFTVDGKFFQIVTTTKASFLKKSDGKEKDDKTILAKHQKWEEDYLNDALRTKLKIDSSWIKLASGQPALAWSYDAPKMSEGSRVKRQLYLTVVKDDHVLVLNTVTEGTDNEKALRQYLINTMATLKPSDKPLSLAKASDQASKD